MLAAIALAGLKTRHYNGRQRRRGASEGGAEIAGGHIAAGKVIGDILAGGLASKGLWKAWLHGEKQVPSDKAGICGRCTREDTGCSRPSRWRV